jgi:hypothetical protein
MATRCWAQAVGRGARPRGDGKDGRSMPPPLPPRSPRHLLTRHYLQIRFRVCSRPCLARALRASNRAAQGRSSFHVCDAAGDRRCRRCRRFRIAMDDDWRRWELGRVGVHLLLYGFNLFIITRLRVGKLIALFPLPCCERSTRSQSQSDFLNPIIRNRCYTRTRHSPPPPHLML